MRTTCYFFLTNPHTTIPNLINNFSQYGYIFNLKINFAKSDFMNISLSEQSLAAVKNNSAFRWDSNSLKYLGIKLTPQLSSLFNQNFTPLCKFIEKDLDRWHKGFFSWFGRAAIIKMTILPKCIYLICSLSINLPFRFFRAFRKVLHKCLWAHKKPKM